MVTEKGESASPKTYSQLYIAARRTLRDAGIEAFSLEARLLLAHAAGKTAAKLLQGMNLYASSEVEEKNAEFLRRRLDGEPVAYITGSWEFYGLPMVISPDVLIPRSDTEVLVDKALYLLKRRGSSARLLDLCTGSGCIGCAIARNLPASRAKLVDISRPALEIARKNVELSGLSDRVGIVETDIFDPPPLRLGSFDMIVSNPPYIATEEIKSLDRSVRDYEPASALDGGDDGLRFYREISSKWKTLLRPGGFLIFEIGETQAEDVIKIMRLNGFKGIECEKDTAGHDRVVSGKI